VRATPWRFTDGIDYSFASPPFEVTIPEKTSIYVVKDPTAFTARYPSVQPGLIHGPYSGWLSNGGEKLELGRPGDLNLLGERTYVRVERVNYSDGSHPDDEPGAVDPWPVEADGNGSLLQRIQLSLYANDPNNWLAVP
jgi:hypothetical protein